MITQKWIEGKYCYVFSKNDVHWALTPEQLLKVNAMTTRLIVDAKFHIAERIAKEKKAAEFEAYKEAKEREEL